MKRQDGDGRTQPPPLSNGLPPLVSVLAPTPRQNRIAVGTMVAALLVFVATAPFAQRDLPPLWAFLPIYQSAFITLSLIVASLLLFQYRLTQGAGVLFLAAGFLFNAAMATAHALSFPGLFAPAGVLPSAGAQTTAWIYFFWHGGFALFVVVHAVLHHRPSRLSPPALILATLALAIGATLLTTLGHDFLPTLLHGDRDTPAKIVVAVLTWATGFLALGLLWRRHPRTQLDLWLMVMLGVWIFDSALAAVLNHGRFDLGWYAGRIFGLVAEGLALIILLRENGALYLELARLRTQENRHSAARLEAGEKRFEATFEQAAVGIALMGLDGTCLRANRKLCRIVGHDDGAPPQASVGSLLALIDCDLDAELIRPILAGRIESRAVETRFRDRNGATGWITLTVAPVTGAEGRPDYFLCVVEDISTRKAAEDQRHRLAEALGQTAQAVVMIDTDTRIVYANPAFLALTEYASDEAIGLPVHRLAPGDAASQAQIDTVLDTVRAGGQWSGECLRLTRSGRKIPVFMTVAGIHDLGGRLTGFVSSYLDISDQKQIRAELESERTLLRTLIHSIPDLIWLKDVNGVYLSSNHAFQRVVGRSEAAIIGCTDHDLLPADQADFFRAHDRLAIEAGGPISNEEWITFADSGQTALLETIKVPMIGSDGTVIGVLGIGRDITRRYQMEGALRESEERFRTYVEAAPLGIFVTDGTGRFLHVNAALVTMLGWSSEVLLARTIADVVAPEDRDRMRDDLLGLSGRVDRIGADYRMITATGTPSWISLSAVRIAADRFAAFCQDITARKEIEAELDRYRQGLEQAVAARTADLESAEARLRLILESSGDGLYGVDVEGRITFVNPAVGAILGWRPEQLIGRTSLEMLHHSYPDGRPFPREACPLLETLRTGTIARFDDDYFWGADGRAVPVSFSVHPMVRDGEIVGAVVSFSDGSARKAADDARRTALAEAKRLATLRREFLANMSHEIRTPLGAILGLAEIGERGSLDRTDRATFSRIRGAGLTLQALIDDILDFSKIESGKMTVESIPFEPGEVIDRAVEMLALRASAKGLRLIVDEAPDLPWRCLGDANRLCQVLVNLLGNAIKFTPAGGSVTLRARRADDRLILAVSDTGIGIAPQAAERLFQPFEQADGSTTRRFGGTGLGLSISRDLVALMGGSVSLDSVVGRGSTFTVALPLAGAEPAPPWPNDAIALLGLDDDEADLVRRTLPRSRRIDGPPRPDDDDPLLVDRRALDDPALVARLAGREGRERRIAVLVDPGKREDLAALLPGAIPIERPLRPRHLRRLADEPPPGREAVAARRGRLAGLRVLGAEDNEVNRLVLDDMLQIEGANLTCFENGRLALDHLREQGAAAFDVVLTDVQMPELDGYDLAREIRRFAPSLPVIGLTAHAMEEERRRCLDAGMIERVVKPITSDALVAAILRHAPVRGTVPGTTNEAV